MDYIKNEDEQSDILFLVSTKDLLKFLEGGSHTLVDLQQSEERDPWLYS